MILSCNICLEKFDFHKRKPLLLDCFHAFCKACLLKESHPIDCPLCVVSTSTPVHQLRVDQVILDGLESSYSDLLSSLTQDAECEFHEKDVHPATHKCVECEQVMCEDIANIHARIKSTSAHYIHRIGSKWGPKDHYPASCKEHNKDLELICIDDGDCPICHLCIASTHHGHKCESVGDFVDKQNAKDLITAAYDGVTRVKKGAEKVQYEIDSLSSNTSATKADICEYFDKAVEKLNAQRKRLLEEIGYLSDFKARVLQKQLQAMGITADNLALGAKCLEYYLGNKHHMKALVVMKQVKDHMDYINKTSGDPREYADIAFQSNPIETMVAGKVIESSASAERSTVQKLTHNRLKITPCNAQGQLITMEGFQVEAANQSDPISLEVTSKEDGSFEVLAIPQREGGIKGGVEVHVKYRGHHVKGSPLKFKLNQKYSWSTIRSANIEVDGNKITSTEQGAWGMIEEEFGMNPQKLNLKVLHHKTPGWSQLVLYETADEEFRSGYNARLALGTYNSSRLKSGGENMDSLYQLERHEDRSVSLYFDGMLVFNRPMPVCYIYVDLYYTTCQAEIF